MNASPDILGLSEVAELAGITTACLSMWRLRKVNDVPRPLAELAMGPVFDKEEIEQWIKHLRIGNGNA